jgi:HK97 family phage portal protein
MQCAPVRCAVQVIAEAVGQLPLHVYARGQDGAKDRDVDHPAYALLHDAANDWTPASVFREQITRDALLHGDGLAFIVRVDGRPFELARLNPEAVSITPDQMTGEPIYTLNAGSDARRVLARQDVLHIKAPSLDGIKGESPVRQAREAIALALVMEAHAARMFANGARPSGLLAFPSDVQPKAIENARAAWQAMNAGTKGGGTAVVAGGASYTPLSLTSVDAQFLELRKFAIEEIARIYRVPPMLLMDYGRATWANGEEMGRQFVSFTLMRWLKAWEGEVRLKLFTAEERATYFAEFLTDDLLRGDLASRMKAYSNAIAARILSPNEARAAENRQPYAGGDTFANPHTSTEAANV